MKRDKSKNYEFFYSELPQTDYLIDIEIQDEYDDQTAEDRTNRLKRGLTDEQVSQIARDSLETAHASYESTETKSFGNDNA